MVERFRLKVNRHFNLLLALCFPYNVCPLFMRTLGEIMRFISILAVCLLPACATLTRGTTEEVNVLVDPGDATITSTIGHSCSGIPCKITAPRKTEFTVTAAKDGYKPQSVYLTSGMSGGGAAGIAGNVLIGGIIGVGVDAASGATLSHTPNPVLIALEPLNSKNATTPRGSMSALEACSKLEKGKDPRKCLADAKANAAVASAPTAPVATPTSVGAKAPGKALTVKN